MANIINAITTGAGGLSTTADASGSIQIATNNGTTAMTIDTSQNVGIGTTNPTVASGYTTLTLNSASNGGIYYLGKAGTNIGALYSASTNAYSLEAIGASTFLQFNTNGAERMRIDSSGNVLVGTTSVPSGGAKLAVAGDVTAGRLAQLNGNAAGDVANFAVSISKFDNNSTTSQRFIGFLINNQSTGSGQINANGASAAAFGSFSDERLKENIEPLSSQLNNILALKPSEFDFKGYEDGMGHQIGFIAQDMQKVYPDVISEGEDGMLIITGWDKTSARLVKAIQEQQTIINELKTRIETLEAK